MIMYSYQMQCTDESPDESKWSYLKFRKESKDWWILYVLRLEWMIRHLHCNRIFFFEIFCYFWFLFVIWLGNKNWSSKFIKVINKNTLRLKAVDKTQPLMNLRWIIKNIKPTWPHTPYENSKNKILNFRLSLIWWMLPTLLLDHLLYVKVTVRYQLNGNHITTFTNCMMYTLDHHSMVTYSMHYAASFIYTLHLVKFMTDESFYCRNGHDWSLRISVNRYIHIKRVKNNE